MKQNRSAGSAAADVVIFAVLLFVAVVTLFPLYYVAIISISNGLDVMRGEVTFLPREVTFDSYKVILQNNDIYTSMRNSIVYTVLGTAINIIMSCMCAYPLTRKNFLCRSLFMKLIVFTMFFSGGMIPLYLVINSLHLLNTMWALLLPSAISTYNMIIIRTSFQAIPESLIEAAKIDGANDMYILWKIVIPLSKAVLATMVLFYAVSQWNSYFPAMLYLNDKAKYPLQIILRNIVVGGLFSDQASMIGKASSFQVTEITLRYATIMVATLPILCVYPFVQKYFVKGVMVGSIKE